MVRVLGPAAAAALAVAASLRTVVADIPKCGAGSPCPASAPCCSQYGQCGVGAYCLGGCDPKYSFKLDSCVPEPVCQNMDFKFNNLDRIASIDRYLGDSSTADWVSSGNPVAYQNQAVLLTMAPDTVGTLLASTHYVWYGKISAKMTTSQGKGVVTAFIMMSDVKDEIDFEFVGVDLENAQTNFYSQGVTNYNNGAKHKLSNTVTNVHTYTIDWTPDEITWQIDGQTVRNKKRSETWNSTSNRFDFPQTPSRIMISLWPAGLPSNGEGTIEWGGGLVDWNSPAMQNGYYYAMLNEVTVECYKPPPGARTPGSKAYHYTNALATNDTVEVIDKQVILASFMATGDNPGDSSKPRTSSGGSQPTDVPESIPGVSGAGVRGEDSGSGSGDSTSSAGGSSSTSSAGSGFSQGSPNRSTGSSVVKDRGLGGSIFAVIIAVFALLVI